MPVDKIFRTIERSDNWSVIFFHPVKLVCYIFPIGIKIPKHQVKESPEAKSLKI